MKETNKRGGRYLAIAAAGLLGLSMLGTASPASAATGDEIAALDSLGLLTKKQVVEVDASADQARSAQSATAEPPASYIEDGSLVTPYGAAGTLRVQPSSSGTVSEQQGVGLQQIDASHSYAFTTETDAAANAGYVIIKDASAPTEFGFDVTFADQDVTLEQLEDGVVSVTSETGEVLNYFLPAWALDANGVPVETSYSVEGTTLVQHVAHEGAAYPVVADPKQACNLVHCTLEFNKSETTGIKNSSVAASAAICGPVTVGFWPVGIACGVYAANAIYAAEMAVADGGCFGMRAGRFPPATPIVGIPHFVTYYGGNCVGSY